MRGAYALPYAPEQEKRMQARILSRAHFTLSAASGLPPPWAPRDEESMTPPPLTIHLFGPLRVTVRGEPLPRVRTRSVEWLLALLALRHGRAVDRSWLAGTLWPVSVESQALANLRNDLMRLRTALGRLGGTVGGLAVARGAGARRGRAG